MPRINMRQVSMRRLTGEPGQQGCDIEIDIPGHPLYVVNADIYQPKDLERPIARLRSLTIKARDEDDWVVRCDYIAPRIPSLHILMFMAIQFCGGPERFKPYDRVRNVGFAGLAGWKDDESAYTEIDQKLPDMTVRTRNTLRREGIETLDKLAATPDETLMEFRNFGKVCLAEVRRHVPYAPSTGELA